MFVSSACMEAHTHAYSHTLMILGRGPAISPRSGIQVSSVYPTYTHIKGQCPLCVCVCVYVCVHVCVCVCMHVRVFV